MSDVADFNKQYKEELNQAVAQAGMPAALLEQFEFESCIRKDKDGKKELYLLTRKVDMRPALLRITTNYPEEDAIEEGKLLAMLNHPAIPKVYAMYEHNGRNYLVREYIAGRSLYESVKASGVLSARDIYGVALKLCDVLGYLYSWTPPIIHRDIKPQNIVVAADGGIHLIDFGIARVHKEGQTQDTSIILSGSYAAPEAYGYGQTNPLTDIYSLGVVLIFMATGSPEKTGLDSRIRDKALRRLIEGCIAFDPRARMQSVRDISAAILRNSGGRKNQKRALLALLLAVVMVCAAIPSYYIGHLKGEEKGSESGYRTGYETGHAEGYVAGYDDAPMLKLTEIPYDPTVGNLQGNMGSTDGGFAARSENEIFYISNGDIYAMNPQTAQTRLLVESNEASSLNYYEGWLYYSTHSDIYRVNADTEEPEQFCEGISGFLTIIDGQFYVRNSIDRLRLYQIDPSGGTAVKLNDLNDYFYLNIIDGRMYFTYHEDGRQLYTCNLDGSDMRVLYEGACEWICSYDNRLYFFNIGQDGSGLLCMNLEDESVEVINQDGANYINVTPAGIFYAFGNNYQLAWLSLDGRNQYKILMANCGYFNIAGEWIFYKNRADDDMLWRVRIDGTENRRVS